MPKVGFRHICRPNYVQIRLSDEEKEHLEIAAEKRGLKLTRFIAWVAIREARKTIEGD